MTRRRRIRLIPLVLALAVLALGLWLIGHGLDQTADVLGCQWERTDPYSPPTSSPECGP